MAAADFSLRVATDPEGRLTELSLSSPTGSPRRSPQRPLRPALKPADAPPRRVQWAARNQVRTFTSSEGGGEQEEEDQAEDEDRQDRHFGHCSGSSRQRQAAQPGSPGWHSPPQAAAASAAAPGYYAHQQPAAYSAPAAQPQQPQQPYWDAAAAAAAYYQQYGWPCPHPVPGHQAQPAAQPGAQPAMQAASATELEPPPPQQQPQRPQQGLSSDAWHGSVEHGSSAPGSPTHLQWHAGCVYITIDSPDVKLRGMRGTAEPCTAPSGTAAAAGEQQAVPAKPAACSAGTQTEPPAEEARLAQASASSSAWQPQLMSAPQPAQPQPQLQPARQPQPLPVQQLQEELPPGIPAGQPPQPPRVQTQRVEEWQPQALSNAAPVPHLRIPHSSSVPAGGGRPAPQQGAAAAGPAFDGDVSSWGQLRAGDSYWEGDGLTTGGSLSSGLSPREGRPRQQEWNHADAMERLAAQSEAYGHAMRQQLRGRGPVSATDALPARLAAQQLASLAGMSRKVQEALLHSQAVFQRQASVVEQAVLARAFWAWRHLHASQQQRRAAALAARRRIDMGRLRRCLHAWRGQCGRHEARTAALQRAGGLLRRGLLHRCWREWRRLVALRAWKMQLEARDQQIQLLGQQEAAARQRQLERAARLLGRLRLQQALAAWQAAVEHEAAWREQVAAAKQLRRRQLAQRAFRGWRYIAWFKRTAAATQRRRQAATMAAALGLWRRHSAAKAATAALLEEMQQARATRLAGRAFGAWAAWVEGSEARRWDEALSRLEDSVQRLGAENEQLKRENERLARVIDSGDWGRQRVQELLEAGRVLQAERDALQKLVGAAAAASGPVGGSGCGSAGMIAAGLPPPLGDATNSPEALPAAAARSPSLAGSGEFESGVLQRYRVSTTGIHPSGASGGAAIPASWGGSSAGGRQAASTSRPTSPAARNKLLVKSGSSFNAMVRALKQDLVTSGALARGTGPAALYEVDKLSLNRLTFNADGAVEVEAVSSPDRRGVAFGSSYPPSPTRQALGAAVAESREQAGQAAARLVPSGAMPAATASVAPVTGSRVGESGRQGQGASSSLLAAALRLQGIGGRSVGLRGSRG